MKKKDIYVVVDTTKKAKKLKNVLDMFGENVHRDCVCHDDGYPYYTSYDDIDCWAGNSSKDSEDLKNKTKVSIKELRNILAKEHLKAGDVCLFDDRKGFKSIGVFDKYSEEYTDFLVSKVPGKDSVCYGFHDFIRYATEEEKALLDPNKELEVGKWYKGNVDIESLIFITEIENVKYYNRIHGYGFIGGKWANSGHLFSNTDHEKSLVEATHEEVERALIEEAKRRGFVNGGVGNNSNIHDTTLEDCELFFNNEYEFDNKDNSLRLILDDDTTWTVFKDGQWATVIEQDKFTVSDIAIVERLHDALLDNHGYSLGSKLLTDARMLANKIKSNIK